MTEFFSLQGKTAIVTGACQGIGRAIALRLAKARATVVVADINECSVLAEEISGHFVHANVADENDVRKLAKLAHEKTGGIDILVNNAGIFAGYKLLQDSSQSDFESCFAVNALGAAFCIKHVAPVMNLGGSIINIGSIGSVTGEVRLSSYVASKFSLAGITKTAALELADRRIRVNCVCPVTVDSPMAREEGGEYLIRLTEILSPLQRLCQPQEVAALVHFLAADDCAYVNGQLINICGGMSAGIPQRAIDKLASLPEIGEQ